MRKIQLAFRDFLETLLHYRIWLHLSWAEVKQRYRRSIIGPWWISLSMLIFILAMGAVFSRLFHQGLSEYIPFFTAGFLFWMFISNCINEATGVSQSNATFIKQVRLPFNLYVFKHISRHVIFLAHNFVVYVLVMIYFRHNPGWVALLAIPGFLLLLINMYWISMLVVLLSARFRDVIPLVASCVQIAFFITPISWMPKLLNPHSFIMKLNPLVYFLGAIRNPLLGTPPSLHTWMYNIGAAGFGMVFTFLVFSRVRARIPFWVD